MQIDNIEEVKTLLVDIEYLFMNLEDVKKQLENEITRKEAEQEDYLHELELAKLNAMEIMKIAKLLIRTRRERRILKDKLELVNTIKGYTDKYITKGITAETNQVIKNIDTLMNNQKSRGYTARIVKNLKCVKKKEQIG